MAVIASMEKNVWCLELFIIYRTLLTKKLYMVCFCHSDRLWHVPVRLSILFISVSRGPSKTDFKELPVMRGRT